MQDQIIFKELYKFNYSERSEMFNISLKYFNMSITLSGFAKSRKIDVIIRILTYITEI